MAKTARARKRGQPAVQVVNRPFPLFYACYLLKSIKTPRSTANYIGSTPNPPRRLRQHNGEITQGAWKTRLSRPWVMQLIVFGFPSKLVALQFEWAWQHPQRSRHLRSADNTPIIASKSKHLKNNIRVVRTMISYPPYNKWPLHVKIFTEDALKAWQDTSKSLENELPLPLGFTLSVELEGVDGKSGQVGSGRKGPIEVFDETFTSSHLAKQSKIIAQSRLQICTICLKSIDLATEDTLLISLCPNNECTGVSHVSCLKSLFLEGETEGTNKNEKVESDIDIEILPRGGVCKECNTYVLWGDIIRGCHRRRYTGKAAAYEDDALEEEDNADSPISDADENSDNDVPLTGFHRKRTEKNTSRVPPVTIAKRGRKEKKKPVSKIPHTHDSGSDVEFFDLDIVSSKGTDAEQSPEASQRSRLSTTASVSQTTPTKRRRSKSRPSRKVAPLAAKDATKTVSPRKKADKPKGTKHREQFVFASSDSSDEEPLASKSRYSSVIPNEPTDRLTVTPRAKPRPRPKTHSDLQLAAAKSQPLLLARAKARDAGPQDSKRVILEDIDLSSDSLEHPLRDLSRGLSSLSVSSAVSNGLDPMQTTLSSAKQKSPQVQDEVIIISD